jgi:hypothetical protein
MDSLPGLMRIPRFAIGGIVLTILVGVIYGPQNWLVHCAYHNWNLLYAFQALHPLVQLSLSATTAVVTYIEFEHKIRYGTTWLFYSEEAAAERVKEKQELRASRLGSGASSSSA